MKFFGRLIVTLLICMICMISVAATAQQRARSVTTSGTIAVTNTYQNIAVADNQRSGCTIQNNGLNKMYVYFGTLANATLALGFQLAAGQVMNCNAGVTIVTDAINITGTATDAFVLSRQ